ncbi:hypothetical protein BVRB_1g019500 [Beta vulgaris subsp. vulgaris]|nr:hypothetical protein BVRB_1g019500 [Beta vulgaris subsp. vulgaris]
MQITNSKHSTIFLSPTNAYRARMTSAYPYFSRTSSIFLA